MNSAGFRRELFIQDYIDVGSRSLISSTSVPRLHAVVDDSQGDTGPLNGSLSPPHGSR